MAIEPVLWMPSVSS